MKKLLKLYVILLLIGGCFPKENRDISDLIKSSRLEDKMRAYYLIGETKDTNYISFLIEDLGNPKISNHLNFKGMSVYQCKINALRKFSNFDPPNEVTYKPDSVNIDFYVNWVLENNLLK
ncbi:MAG: hypothetical protein AB7S69_04570 [Salinivirgaceae bacterium]